MRDEKNMHANFIFIFSNKEIDFEKLSSQVNQINKQDKVI